MKRMMFNDRFGLTNAVIEKRKTVTRRVINPQPDRARHWNPIYVKDELMYYQDERGMCQLLDEKGKVIYPPYKVGEIVAVAQSYYSVMVGGVKVPYKFDINLTEHKGWTNKMFVRADLMPHQIRILNVRAERLQDITDDDCLREGIEISKSKHIGLRDMHCLPNAPNKAKKVGWCNCYHTSKEAFTILIDKISGKGTWNSNPFVWRIEFEYINQ